MDQSGFDAFVAAEEQRLARLAYLLTGSRTGAEDVLQSALVIVLERWSRVQAMDSPGGYATRVLVNEARSRWRRDRRERDAHLRAVLVVVDDDPTSGWDARTDLVAAVAQLPRRQRAVVVLRYFADLSEADTAAALGCRVGTVKSQASKALATLRSHLTADDPLEAR